MSTALHRAALMDRINAPRNGNIVIAVAIVGGLAAALWLHRLRKEESDTDEVTYGITQPGTK